ncbi:tyrosine-type recombinase/integrase [Miltoncostaea marina]|uniref:tyrosine-type recombinase/integrase n=1 Tax=Miltoncostaea marina TaxID=2843215 RepID=UPI001C3C2494|nr:tyrosine-type recombinase/integrase [Miltoncostaea marina]
MKAALLASHSGHTRAAYERCLDDFGRFLHQHGIPHFAASRAVVDAYRLELLEVRKLAPATVAQRLSALAGFYDYAVDEGLIDRSPAERVKRPKLGKDSPRLGMYEGEVRRFLEAAHEAGPRNSAIACLGVLNGLRLSEICGAEWILARSSATASCASPARAAPRSTSRWRRPPSTPSPRPSARAPPGRSSSGATASRSTASSPGASCAGSPSRRASTKPLSPHSMRHTFVTQALAAGIPLHIVQDDAGHADPRTTMRYNRARRSLDKAATPAGRPVRRRRLIGGLVARGGQLGRGDTGLSVQPCGMALWRLPGHEALEGPSARLPSLFSPERRSRASPGAAWLSCRARRPHADFGGSPGESGRHRARRRGQQLVTGPP